MFCVFSPQGSQDYRRVLLVEVTHSLRMMAREYVELKTLNTDHPLDHFVQPRSLSSADLTFSKIFSCLCVSSETSYFQTEIDIED